MKKTTIKNLCLIGSLLGGVGTILTSLTGDQVTEIKIAEICDKKIAEAINQPEEAE